MKTLSLDKILNKPAYTGLEIGLIEIDDYIHGMKTGNHLLSDSEMNKLENCLIHDNFNIRDYNHMVGYNGILNQITKFMMIGMGQFLEAETRLKTVYFMLKDINLKNRLIKHESSKELLDDLFFRDTDKDLIKVIIKKANVFLNFAYICYNIIDLFSDRINKPELKQYLTGYKGNVELTAVLAGYEYYDLFESDYDDPSEEILKEFENSNNFNDKINILNRESHIISQSFINPEKIEKAREYINSVRIPDIDLHTVKEILGFKEFCEKLELETA